jgi:hypothetical protein
LTKHKTTGVAADISHINTKSNVKGYDPTPSGLRECLSGADIILVPAGVPRKPGMTRDGKKGDVGFHPPRKKEPTFLTQLLSFRSLQHQR